MKTTNYQLRVKSGTWRGDDPAAYKATWRLVRFTMTANRRGEPLAGNNEQVMVGAPDYKRRGLDQDVVMWLASGWWVSLRNQFAQAPDVAVTIVQSAAAPLSAVTHEFTMARGARTNELSRELFAWDQRREVRRTVAFEATGPDYWR